MKTIYDDINSVRRRVKSWMVNRPWFQVFNINVNLHDLPRYGLTSLRVWFSGTGLSFGVLMIDFGQGPPA